MPVDLCLPGRFGPDFRMGSHPHNHGLAFQACLLGKCIPKGYPQLAFFIFFHRAMSHQAIKSSSRSAKAGPGFPFLFSFHSLLIFDEEHLFQIFKRCHA